MRAHRVLEEGGREAPAEARPGELSPVRVSAQRQSDAARRELWPERRVVREGDDCRARGDAGECALDVRRRARRAALSARRVTSADEGQRRIAAPDDVRLVDEHRAELRRPECPFDRVPAGVDVVVAGDHEDAKRRLERA